MFSDKHAEFADRRPSWFGWAAGALALAVVSAQVGAQITLDGSTYRIGMSFDGNQHDLDDILAAPMAMAMLGEAGLQDRLTHLDFNNHLGDNNATRAQTMRDSVLGAANRWGFDASVLFDDQITSQLNAGTANLAAQINASGPDNPFFIAAGGPMETVWRGVNASDPAKRQFATVISHSDWNNNHSDTPQLAHKFDDIKTLGINTIQIRDQNANLNNSENEWNWLENASNADWRWLFDRNRKSKFDTSDAGMTWYIMTGRGETNASPNDVRNLFEGNFVTSDGTPPPADPNDGLIEIRNGGVDDSRTAEAKGGASAGVGNAVRNQDNRRISTGTFSSPQSDHRAAVTVFQLPALADGQHVDTADLRLYLHSKANESQLFNIDLWATRVDSTGTVQAEDYAIGNGPFAGQTLIMRDFATPEDSVGWLSLDDPAQQALGAFLRDNADPGDFIAFRLTADITPAEMSGLAQTRYQFRADHPDYIADGTEPVLALTVVPEPASAVIWAVTGAWVAIRRNSTHRRGRHSLRSTPNGSTPADHKTRTIPGMCISPCLPSQPAALGLP